VLLPRPVKAQVCSLHRTQSGADRLLLQFLGRKSWYGWRLVAVDGSTVQVPNTPENLAHFGAWQPAKGAPCPMARISQMFDVLNDVTLEALIVPRVGESENWPPTIFLIYNPGDLVLLDRVATPLSGYLP